jgi:hypothetical protein
VRCLIVVAVALAGCFPTSSWDCDTDGECSFGEVCARTHECLLSSDVRMLRVDWIVDGNADLVAACPAAAIDRLGIVFAAADPTDTLTYVPVPCDTGQFVVDKLPSRMTTVELTAYDFGGAQVRIATGAIGPDPNLSRDLR